MGGDTVTDCSSLEGRDYKARLSYNPGKSNRKAPLAYGLESKILHTHHAKVADGIIYCRFSQLIQPPESVQPQFVRPLNAPIFILLASGVTRGKDLTIHSLNSDSSLFPFSSSHPIQLTKFNLSPEELANGDWEINKYNNNNNYINSSINMTKELSIPFNENNLSLSVIEQTTTNNLKTDSTTTSSSENINNNINEEKSPTKILEKENQKNNLNNENISLNSNSKNDCSDSGITFGTTTNKPEIGSDAFLTSNNSEFRLIKTHGILMVFAWLFLVPGAILSARFLHHRNQREPLELFGIQLWFQIHRLANSLAFLFVIISFLCIYSALDGFWIGPRFSNRSEQNFSTQSLHAFFGILSIFICLFQPICAIFRCSPESPKRFIFNWIHSILGYIAWICSAIAISLACLKFEQFFIDSFLARDVLIASLVLTFISFFSLQWFSLKRRERFELFEEENERRRNASSLWQINLHKEYNIRNINQSTNINQHLRPPPQLMAMAPSECSDVGGHRESLMIQQAIIGLFFVASAMLSLCLAITLMLA
uniref:ascorbate ferrireductase (transmembrane) n=1 Tax=Meloidogyne incognita TaxID=6306 RepID=A0A914MUF4_MELIC